MSKRYGLFTMLLLCAIVLGACQQEAATTEAPPPPTDAPAPATDPPPAPAEPIKIGFMGPLTGGAAFIGEEQLGFAQAAVAIFNDETGMNVEIVEGDTEINPDTGRIVAELFVADAEIIGVVGPAGSQVCESTQPVFEEAGLAHITPSCTRTDLTQPGTSTFFRPIPVDADQSVTDAAYMVDVLGVSTAYLVDDQSSYSTGLNEELEGALNDLGASVVGRASVTQEDTDFSSVVTSIITLAPDVVFFPSQIEAQEGTLAVQLREQGYEGTYFLADGGFTLGWIEQAGDAAEGTYVSFFSPDPKLVPEAAAYNDYYVANVDPNFGAFGGAAAYTTRILLEAIGRCADDLSRACVRDEMAATNMSTSPLGIPVSFGDGNQIEGGKFFLFQVQNGDFQLLGEDQAGAAVDVMAPATAIDYDGTITIGFMGPLTGGAAFIGEEQLGFAQAAVAIYNAETGLDIQIEQGDTEINPDVGRLVAELFVANDDIVAVVGPAGSQVCESTQPVFEEAGMTHITPSCTRTDLTQPGTATFFRPIPVDADQSVTDADYMVNELGISTAYLVDDQSSYSTGLNEELEAALDALGASVVGRASVTQEDTDFSSVVTDILSTGADVVFFPSQIEAQEGTLAIQLQEQGYEGIYFLADGGFTLGWIEQAGEAAEGTYVSFFSPDPNLVPEAKPYNDYYVANVAPEFGAFGGAAAYTTRILLEAIGRCASADDVTRGCITTEMVATDMSTSPLAIPVSFGEGNQIQGGKFFLFIVEDGQFKLIQ